LAYADSTNDLRLLIKLNKDDKFSAGGLKMEGASEEEEF